MWINPKPMDILGYIGHDSGYYAYSPILIPEVRRLCDKFKELLKSQLGHKFAQQYFCVYKDKKQILKGYEDLSIRLTAEHNISLPSANEIFDEIDTLSKEIKEDGEYIENLSAVYDISRSYTQFVGKINYLNFLNTISKKNIRELLSGIKELGVYSPEEWNEYLSYFIWGDKLGEEIGTPRNLAERIKRGRGAELVSPDYTISAKVERSDFFTDEKNRSKATIGIVSGCFDLLHLGHIRGMAYAKQFLSQYPNSLLVTLTLSDANIKAKKGESRPILNLNERLEMLCNVDCVDYVVPLEEPNCLAVLGELRPDYFFKANADRSQDIVRQEMELVESNGGKVVVFPPRPGGGGKSTTEMIESVVEKMMREW